VEFRDTIQVMKLHFTNVLKVYPTSLGLVPLNQMIVTYYDRSIGSWVSQYRDSDGLQIGSSVFTKSKNSSIEEIKQLHGIQ
jgi:hypothetical protein